MTEAKAEVRRTAVALDSATLAGAAAAMADAVAARRRGAAAVAKVAADAELRHRQRWLRQGEAPCPAMSAVVRRPRSAGAVAGIRVGGPSGGLVTTGPGMAAVMAKEFAAISVAPAVDAASRDAVLAAVGRHSGEMDPAEAEWAGAQTTTPREVAKAASRLRAAAAPGPDGLPPALWRRGGRPCRT